MKEWTENFGFLTEPWEIKTPVFSIFPLEDHAKRLELIKERLYKKSLLPPIMHTASLSHSSKEWVPEPNSQTSASLFYIDPSHTLIIHNPSDENPVKGLGGFLIHFIAMMNRTRAQFETWMVDGRIPIENQRLLGMYKGNFPLVFEKACDKYLELGNRNSGQIPSRHQLAFVNALWTFGKAYSANHQWEEFSLRYMALDGFWKAINPRLIKDEIPKDLVPIIGDSKESHAARFWHLANNLGLDFKSTREDGEESQGYSPTAQKAKEFVKLRNDLIHECNWDGGFLGENSKLKRGLFAPIHLAKFFERAVLSYVIGKNNYSSFDWTHGGEPFLTKGDFFEIN